MRICGSQSSGTGLKCCSRPRSPLMAAWFLWVDRPHHQAQVFGTVDRRDDRGRAALLAQVSFVDSSIWAVCSITRPDDDLSRRASRPDSLRSSSSWHRFGSVRADGVGAVLDACRNSLSRATRMRGGRQRLGAVSHQGDRSVNKEEHHAHYPTIPTLERHRLKFQPPTSSLARGWTCALGSCGLVGGGCGPRVRPISLRCAGRPRSSSG